MKRNEKLKKEIKEKNKYEKLSLIRNNQMK